MADATAAVVAPAKSGGLGASLRAFLSYSPSKVKPQITILFCRQLASFVRVGVPVVSAIETFAEQAPNKMVRDAYVAVAADIQEGIRLSDAFARHPKVFPRILCDMVRSAELSGNLDVVLRQAARHIEREASARAKIRAAMTYPAIIMCFALLIAIGIIVFVLPKFKELYAGLGVQTPGILNALLDFSGFVRGNALAIALGVLIAIILFGIWMRTESGRYRVDIVLVRLPAIASLIRASMVERFCRTLGDMLTAGVPISQTYAVVTQNTRNRVYRRALEKVAPEIAAGKGLYRPLQATQVFPQAVIQMFRVGEETGHLDSNLVEAAEMYDEEVEYRIKRMTAFLEPAMIVFVGVIVGFVAVTLITSIYSLAGNFK